MIRTSITNIVLRVTSVGMMMLINVMLARSMGASNYGHLSYALAWMQILMIFVQFGLPAEMTRSIAILAGNDDKNLIMGKIVTSHAFILSNWLVVIALVSGVLLVYDAPNLTMLFLTPLLILILLNSVVALNSGILRGFGLIVRSQIPDQIVRPILYLSGVAGFTFFKFELTPLIALWIQAIALVVTATIGAKFLLSKLPTTSEPLEFRPKQHFHVALPFLFLAAIQVLSAQIPLIFVGYIEPPASVAQLRVATQITDAFNIILLGIATVIGPKIAHYHEQARWKELRGLLRQSHFLGFFFFLIPALLLVVYSQELIAFIFGPEFTAANRALQILIVGKLVYSLMGFSGLVLAMTGRAKAAFYATSISLVVMLAMLGPLTFGLDVEGAAFALAFNGVLTSLLCILFYPKEIRGL